MERKLHYVSLLLLVLGLNAFADDRGLGLDPSEPADVRDVEVTAVNIALLGGDSLRIVSPEQTRRDGRRRVSPDELNWEGWAEGPTANSIPTTILRWMPTERR